MKRSVALSDHVTEVSESGAGLALICIHAIAVDGAMWEMLHASLSFGIRAIAYDVRGHGRTTTSIETIERCAQDVVALADALGLESFHVMGLSMGGTIAQHVALLAPSRVASLILAATFSRADRALLEQRAYACELDGVEAQIPQTLQRWFTAEALERGCSAIDYASRTIAANSSQRLAAAWRALSRVDTWERLPDIVAPPTVLAGERDAAGSVAAARSWASRLRRATLRSVVGAPHMFPLEMPAVTARLIDEHLAAIATL